MEIRLYSLQKNIESLIKIYKPNVIAMESAYCGVNAVTTLRLGFACGAIFVACGKNNIPVIDYPTTVVKQCITGGGSQKKEQVRDKIQEMFSISIDPLDASDALAVAITHAMLYLKNSD